MFHDENWISVPASQALQLVYSDAHSGLLNVSNSLAQDVPFGQKDDADSFDPCPLPELKPSETPKNEVSCYDSDGAAHTSLSGTKKGSHRQQEVSNYVEKLKAGFTRFPNSILMQMIHGDLSKAEIKVLLLIARLTISFIDEETGKECQFVSLSKNTIADYLGINSKTALESLHSLEEKKLIRKIQGNFLEKNQFGLVYTDGLFDRKQPFDTPPSEGLSGGRVENVPWGGNSTQEGGKKSNQGEGGNSHQPQGQKSTHYKQYDLNNILNNLSLKHPCPPLIQDYFLSLETDPKRKSELEKYESLSKKYPPEYIGYALDYLKRFGVPHTGDRCHSPMAYLSLAMGEVLSVAEEYDEKQKRREEEQKKQKLQKERETAEEEEQNREFRRKSEAFYKALPDRQIRQEYLKKVAEKFPFCDPNGEAVLKLAISYWALDPQNLTNPVRVVA